MPINSHDIFQGVKPAPLSQEYWHLEELNQEQSHDIIPTIS